MWSHDAAFGLLRDGRLQVHGGDALAFFLAPVLGPFRDLVLLRMALSGNRREWPGEFAFFFPWVVALVTFSGMVLWWRRRVRRPGEDVAGTA